MKEKAEAFIQQINTANITQQDVDDFITEVKNAIKASPADARDLGQYIARIGTAFRNKPTALDIPWIKVGGGALAIGHKPGGKLPFDGMKAGGATSILTLLQENEDAARIGKGTQHAGMNWIWFPFSASRPHEGDATKDVEQLYGELAKRLADGEHIYIHCSAGIHRTGMVTYGLLRFLGQDSLTARQTLLALREVTSQQVGEERLVWGDQFARPRQQ